MIHDRANPTDEALVVAYVDDSLPPEALAAFERRLAAEPQLEDKLNEFLAADALGRRLGGRGLLAKERRSSRRAIAGWITASVAAAAALLWTLWLRNEPAVRLDVANVHSMTSRGDASGTSFELRLTCRRECYVLLFAVTLGAAGPQVHQLHPIEAGPLATQNPNWPKDPFPAGAQITLPAPLPDGTASFPFEVTGRGLLVLCARTTGPFAAAAIRDVTETARAAAAREPDLLDQLPTNRPDRAAVLRRFLETVRGAAHEASEVDVREIGAR